MPSGVVIRSCPNCHEGLRISSGPGAGIELLGRKVWDGDPERGVATVEPAVDDGEKGASLEAEDRSAGLVALLEAFRTANRVACDALIQGQLGTSLHGEAGPTPGPIEMDEPYGLDVPGDATESDFAENELGDRRLEKADYEPEPAPQPKPTFALPAEMVVRLRIRVGVDGINV